MKVAVIPARGGSKRIPRKNIKPFANQPIIAYSIRAAQDSGVCERIIVSTDDDEIAAIARDFGAETPFCRPPELANDHAGTMEVIQHAIDQLMAEHCMPSHVCCLYPTAPFVTGALIREALDALADGKHAYAFPVTSFEFPVQRALRIVKENSLQPLHPEFSLIRSQDLEPAYHDAGQFYWGKTAAWRAGTTVYSAASRPVMVPRHHVQDIDTPEDWERAEWLYRGWLGLMGAKGKQ